VFQFFLFYSSIFITDVEMIVKFVCLLVCMLVCSSLFSVLVNYGRNYWDMENVDRAVHRAAAGTPLSMSVGRAQKLF
jgi:hypothetical protein